MRNYACTTLNFNTMCKEIFLHNSECVHDCKNMNTSWKCILVVNKRLKDNNNMN